MKTSTYNAWWRELGAIGRGMMFIEGNIATSAGLDLGHRPAPRPSRRPRRLAQDARKGFSLYEDLLFLGGRPMTAGHNDDTEEPFPQTGANAVNADVDTAQVAGNTPRHALSTRKPGHARRRTLQGLALLALAATVWAFSPAPSAPTALAPMTVVEARAASVQPTVAADPLETRIVDLPAVTVRPTPEDYGLLAAENIRRVDCLAC